MKSYKRSTGALALLGAILGFACGANVSAGGGANGGGGANAGGGGNGGGGGQAASLTWYKTCGDPVCNGHTAQAGIAPCTTENAGAACASDGALCDPSDACNALLSCTDSDPTQQVGGCPVSRAKFKHGIEYLSDAERDRVRDDLLAMRLATWRYNHEGQTGPTHLGFIIDDDPESPAVASTKNHVDLYGYTSMAVAAVQAQEAEIAVLRAEVAELKRAVEAQREAGREVLCGGGSVSP